MPFWWRRRNRWWRGRRRPYYRRRKYTTKTRRRYYRRKPRRSTRRRYRRRKKVRRKRKLLNVKIWQPATIRKCKIKGLACNILGAEGRQFVSYPDNRFAWIPPKTPAGGGFAVEMFTLKYLFDEYTRGNNIWTTSNTYLDLCRYTGCKIIFFKHPTIDFVIHYSRQLPMLIDKYTYADSHPFELLKKKHKIIVQSLKHSRSKKPYVKVRIKPPRQMSTKWFFQEGFSETGLVRLTSAAASLSYSYLGCCNENTGATLYCLNIVYYAQTGWGNSTPPGTISKWYVPRKNIAVTQYETGFNGIDYTGKQVSGKITYTSDPQTGQYLSSTNKDTGWFQPTLLSIVDLKHPEQTPPLHIKRYNPSIDTGAGNQVYLLSVLNTSGYDPPKTDSQLILEGRPLWQLLYGFPDYCNKIKKDPRFTDSYYLVIVSPAIEPHAGEDRIHIVVDVAMLQGKGRYGSAVTPYRAQHWYPTLEHQLGSINSIVECGPYIPKLANQTLSTWELKSRYTFYFKWGGAELPEQEVENPKTKGTYEVPDKLQAIQITDPSSQKASRLLHSWDWRRGYVTRSALKRIIQDSDSDDSLQTATEQAPPKKKYKTPKGNEVPVLQEKEEEIQDCLLSLFEEPTCQDQTQTVQDLIKQQQQQQQHLKLNLLKLISDLKRKQQMIQLQTGLLS
nr:MAG: ORF1 [Torque teno midi virus]